MGTVAFLGERLNVVRTPEQTLEHQRELNRSRQAAKDRARAAKRKAETKRRTPPWADMRAIEAVYNMAERMWRKTGARHDVDHIIPLQGELVSGLHVAENLQVLRWDLNRQKSNKFDPASYGHPVGAV